MRDWPAKLSLAHTPTPLERAECLDALVGCELWIKRDDASGGAEAGNKIRKLEYLLHAARSAGADTVVTCGGLQSNHARATAILARRLQLQPLLLLRTADGRAPTRPFRGNLQLDRLLGAELRFITPEQYRARNELMASVADELGSQGRRAYVIPEGGSNGLGSLGYVDAMAEVRAQLDAHDSQSPLPERFDAVVHACGSGGTAAGIGIGARLHGVADEVIALAVCDDRAYFEQRVAAIQAEAHALLPAAARASARVRVVDAFKGPAYAVPSAEQIAFIAQVARASGVILDPVYTGKALFGLSQLEPKPRRALFVHTGGLPGLLAEAERF